MSKKPFRTGPALLLLAGLAACVALPQAETPPQPADVPAWPREADLRPPLPPRTLQAFGWGFHFGIGPQATPTPTPRSTTTTATTAPLSWLFGRPAPTPKPTPTPTPKPTPTPTATPTPTPAPTATPNGGAIALHLDPTHVLHPATSHVLGAIRNHVASQFPNGAAKLAAMAQLVPIWGERKYLYRIGHGITDGRYDYSYMTGFHFETVWGAAGPYPYDDLRGAVGEAAAMGADMLHVVNFGTSTADEAARYTSYLDHAGDPNQFLEPCANTKTALFELGNEMSWRMERGHDLFAPDEITYGQRAADFARAMRAASDVPIRIGAVATTNSSWTGDGWSGGATTVRNLLGAMGDQVDFLTYHGYPSWPIYRQGDLLTIMAQNEWNRREIEGVIKPAIAATAPGRDVWIANTEYGVGLYNDPIHARGLFAALYGADTIALAMNEDIRICEQFCLDHGQQPDSAFFLSDDPTDTTAVYKLHALLARHWGDQIVAWSATGLPTVPVSGPAAQLDLPLANFAAGLSADGRTVYLLAVNRTNDQDLVVNLDPGFAPTSVTAYTLAGAGGWDASNGDVTTSHPAANAVSLPRASVTVVELTR